jgi:hypothetical protein
MKKEDFKLEYENLKNQISEINLKIIDLEKKYIDANKTLNIGDRVYSAKEKQYGYVNEFVLDWNKNIKPKVLKEKKDGTMSMISLYVFSAEDVVLCPKS